MTRSISTNPLPSVQRPPVAREASKPQEADRAPAAGDRLDLGTNPLQHLLEADLRIKVAPGPSLIGHGNIGFNRVFVERLLRFGLSKSEDVKNPRIAFHEGTRSYSVQAVFNVRGIDVPFSVRVKPVVEGNVPGFKLENLRIPLGNSGRFGIEHEWLTGKVSEELAKQLQWDLGARAIPEKGVVTLNPSRLLHTIGALPDYLSLDMQQTQFQAGFTATGDMNVVLRAPGMAPVQDTTPGSDITVEADEQSLSAVLRHALAPNYEVQGVSLETGQGVIDGRAEFKQGSDVINAGKLIIALIGLAGGDPRAANLASDPTRLMVGLDLAFKIEGTHMTITPSIDKALGDLGKSLEAAGLRPVQQGNSLRVDLGALLESKGRLESIDVRQDVLNLRMRLDLDAIITNPILKGAQLDGGPTLA